MMYVSSHFLFWADRVTFLQVFRTLAFTNNAATNKFILRPARDYGPMKSKLWRIKARKNIIVNDFEEFEVEAHGQTETWVLPARQR